MFDNRFLKLLVKVLSVAFIVALFACDSENSKQITLDKTPGVDNLSSGEAHQYLEVLSQKITSSNSSDGLLKSAHSGRLFKQETFNKLMKFEKLSGSEVLPDVPEQIMVDGKPHRIHFESFNCNQLGKLSKPLEGDGPILGVYVDPASYFDGVSDHVDYPVQILSFENGEYVTTTETWSHPYAADNDLIDDKLNSAIDAMKAGLTYPVFALTIEEISDESDDRDQLGKSTAMGYLAFRAVWLKTERDGSTDEEFEVWWGPESGYLYNAKKFDGGKYNEPATGQSVRYPDVDHKNHWYNAQDNVDPYVTIGLVALDNTTAMAVAPWEDDQSAGKIARFNWITDPTGNRFVSKLYTDIFNAGSNAVDDDKYLRTDFDEAAVLDEDDPYAESPLYNLTYTNVVALTGNRAYSFDTDFATNHPLGDIRWIFRLK